MILLEKYTHSKRPYAVDMRSFVVDHHPATPWIDQNGDMQVSMEYWRLSINAIWFRGKVAAPEACFGTLRWSTGLDPMFGHVCVEDAARVAVSVHDDGRYGGDCIAKLRSDGTLWTSDQLAVTSTIGFERRLTPVLQGFPSVPDGYDGWWSFVDGR